MPLHVIDLVFSPPNIVHQPQEVYRLRPGRQGLEVTPPKIGRVPFAEITGLAALRHSQQSDAKPCFLIFLNGRPRPLWVSLQQIDYSLIPKIRDKPALEKFRTVGLLIAKHAGKITVDRGTLAFLKGGQVPTLERDVIDLATAFSAQLAPAGSPAAAAAPNPRAVNPAAPPTGSPPTDRPPGTVMASPASPVAPPHGSPPASRPPGTVMASPANTPPDTAIPSAVPAPQRAPAPARPTSPTSPPATPSAIRPIPARSTPRPAGGKPVASLAGALLAGVCFFLPWKDMGSREPLTGLEAGGLLWLVPVCALVIILAIFRSSGDLSRGKGPVLLAALVGFGLVFFDYVNFGLRYGRYWGMEYGAKLAMLGFVSALVGGLFLAGQWKRG